MDMYNGYPDMPPYMMGGMQDPIGMPTDTGLSPDQVMQMGYNPMQMYRGADSFGVPSGQYSMQMQPNQMQAQMTNAQNGLASRLVNGLADKIQNMVAPMPQMPMNPYAQQEAMMQQQMYMEQMEARKPDLVQLREALQRNYGYVFMDGNIKKLPDAPMGNFRHACENAGVVSLPVEQFNSTKSMITYSVCKYCGKLFYYRDKVGEW